MRTDLASQGLAALQAAPDLAVWRDTSRAHADDLIQWLKEYARSRINSRLIDERRCIPPYVVMDFGNRGLLGLEVPESHGGIHLTTVDTLRVVQQLGAVDLTLASFVGVHNALGIHPILKHARPELRDALLPRLATGRELAAFALTEPGAGSNPRAIASKAVEHDSGWRLNGRKTWIGSGSWASVINVFVRLLSPGSDPGQIVGFVLRQGKAGLHHGPEALTMGMRGMVQNALELRDVTVTADELLGDLHSGFLVAQDAMAIGRLGIAAMSVGAMRRSAQLILRYATRRTIGTGRLVENPVVGLRVSEISAAVEAVEALTERIAEAIDCDATVPPEAYMACKIAGPEFLGRAADALVQLLGGRGYIETNAAPQLFRDARLLRIFEGPTETLSMFLGANLAQAGAPVYRFLREDLGAARTAVDLAEAVGRVTERYARKGSDIHSRQGAYLEIGEVATLAFLWAATDDRARRAPSQSRTRAARWAEASFRDRVVQALRERAAEAAALTTTALEHLLEIYTQDIGDIEQELPGEDVEFDPLLRSASAPRAGVVPSHDARAVTKIAPLVPPVASGSATPPLPAPTVSTPPEGRTPRQGPEDRTAGIRQWLAQRLALEPSTIDRQRALTSLGLDSLSAVELRCYLQEQFGLDLPMERFFEGMTLEELAEQAVTAADQVARQEQSSATPTMQPPAPPSRPSEVVADERTAPPAAMSAVALSLFFFSSNAEQSERNRYRLFLECARFADANGFEAIWSPERHFHPFGGLYPNPSVLGAAAAALTRRVRIRGGSVVLPLHNPVRVAEEWSAVDNLSGGRVDVAFATGWSADDFVLAPDNYASRGEVLIRNLDVVRRLWRGEKISLPNGLGFETAVRVYPPPVQRELPIWITCSGGPERFQQAGALGANVLTALLFQSVEELAEKIRLYRQARAAHGHDPAAGRVTLMLHAFVGRDEAEVRRAIESPFKTYLLDSIDLWRRSSKRLDELSAAERQDLLDYAFERYFRTSALFGTPDGCAATVERLAALGVGEIACLVDFGVPEDAVLEGLQFLKSLGDRMRRPGRGLATPEVQGDGGHRPPPTAAAGGPAGTASRGRHPASAAPSPQTELSGELGDALRSRHVLAHRSGGGILQKARAFDLPLRLRELDLLPFYTELTRNEGATCIYEGRSLIMLGSNNYLGLTADSRVREATAAAALVDGPSLTGSRLLNGSTKAHSALEHRLAAFLGREDALVFATGYQANIGLLSALMGEGTTLLVDEQCHASVYDGAAVARCRVVQFQHNDVNDLEGRLAHLASVDSALVMVDGVYSMLGDLAPLPEIRAACDRFGVPLAIDDAHGLGMVGATGRGTEEELGVLGCADMVAGTFSKSLASIGGWIVGDRDVMDWIRFNGRSMLFSAAIPPTCVAAADAALDILIAEPRRVEQVGQTAAYWRGGLRRLGFNTGCSRTAIVPVIVGDDMKCMQVAKALLDAGVYVNCVVSPAVPREMALLRTSVMATHETHHLDQALEIFAHVGSRLDLI